MTRIDAALLLAVLLSASCGSEERGEYEERAGTGSITKIGQSSTQVILWAESAAIEDLIDTSVFGGAELPTSITALEGKLGISERFLDPAGNSGARFKVGNAVLSAIEWRGPAGAPRMAPTSGSRPGCSPNRSMDDGHLRERPPPARGNSGRDHNAAP